MHWERADRFDAWPEREQVAVPSCLEEYRLDYQGVAWYGRRFATPPEWAGCPMLLQFDAVNYRAEVWLNGEPAGAHDGDTPDLPWRWATWCVRARTTFWPCE